MCLSVCISDDYGHRHLPIDMKFGINVLDTNAEQRICEVFYYFPISKWRSCTKSFFVVTDRRLCDCNEVWNKRRHTGCKDITTYMKDVLFTPRFKTAAVSWLTFTITVKRITNSHKVLDL